MIIKPHNRLMYNQPLYQNREKFMINLIKTIRFFAMVYYLQGNCVCKYLCEILCITSVGIILSENSYSLDSD